MLRTRRARVVPLVAALGAMLAACGSDATPQVATLAAADADAAEGDTTAEAVDSEEALLAFAECMRDQGIDFADPVAGEDGTLRFGAPGGGQGGQGAGFDPSQREQMQAAREACGDLIEGLAFGGRGGGPGQGAFDSEVFLAFAECMRENGVEDYPDPAADGRPDIEAMRELDTTSGEFQEASSTCSEEVGFQGPGAGGFRGREPGGPGGRGGPAAGDQG